MSRDCWTSSSTRTSPRTAGTTSSTRGPPARGTTTASRGSRRAATPRSPAARSRCGRTRTSRVEGLLGGSLALGNDGKLYISTGENWTPADAQRLDIPRGKILRINKDGTIPTDNPFYDGAGPNRDEIWAYGLRNPFRMSIDPVTGTMYIGDVGSGDHSPQRGAQHRRPWRELRLADLRGTVRRLGNDEPDLLVPARRTGRMHDRRHRLSREPVPERVLRQLLLRRLRPALGSPGQVRRERQRLAGHELLAVRRKPGQPDRGRSGQARPGARRSALLRRHRLLRRPRQNPAAIRRIRYVLGNQQPVAMASATPTSGQAPLPVTFSSAGSSDPEGAPLSYSWTFGDGATSTQANPTHTYSAPGQYVARLTVSDGTSSAVSSDLTIRVGTPPTPTILTPATGALFRAGDVISYSGSATDAEDGPLPPSAFSWTILFHHDSHIHPGGGPFTNTTSGTLPIPTSGHAFEGATNYEIVLTVTDSTGLSASTSVTIVPDKVNVTYDSVPSGLTLTIDGISRQTPFVVDDLKGFQRTITAPNQSSGGTAYNFASWSDGGVAEPRRRRSDRRPEPRRHLPGDVGPRRPGRGLLVRRGKRDERRRRLREREHRLDRDRDLDDRRQVRQRALVQRLDRAGDRPRLGLAAADQRA